MAVVYFRYHYDSSAPIVVIHTAAVHCCTEVKLPYSSTSSVPLAFWSIIVGWKWEVFTRFTFNVVLHAEYIRSPAYIYI